MSEMGYDLSISNDIDIKTISIEDDTFDLVYNPLFSIGVENDCFKFVYTKKQLEKINCLDFAYKIFYYDKSKSIFTSKMIKTDFFIIIDSKTLKYSDTFLFLEFDKYVKNISSEEF